MLSAIILWLISYVLIGLCTALLYVLHVADDIDGEDCFVYLVVIFWPLFYLGLLIGAIAAIIDVYKRG